MVTEEVIGEEEENGEVQTEVISEEEEEVNGEEVIVEDVVDDTAIILQTLTTLSDKTMGNQIPSLIGQEVVAEVVVVSIEEERNSLMILLGWSNATMTRLVLLAKISKSVVSNKPSVETEEVIVEEEEAERENNDNMTCSTPKEFPKRKNQLLKMATVTFLT